MLCTSVSGLACARLALVMTFSATGRSAFALASVVTIASAATSDATRFDIISRWYAASPPKRRDLRGLPCMTGPSVLHPELQAALVELGLHFVERLLAEVGDREQVVVGLHQQFADRVDLGALEAVARTLGQIEVFDRQLEV